MASPNPACCNPKTQYVIPTARVSRKVGRAYMFWAEQHLRNREAFVAHVEDLLAIDRLAVGLAYVAVPISREVGKHVFLNNRIPALISPESNGR
jgi:hypothetical protein